MNIREKKDKLIQWLEKYMPIGDKFKILYGLICVILRGSLSIMILTLLLTTCVYLLVKISVLSYPVGIGEEYVGYLLAGSIAAATLCLTSTSFLVQHPHMRDELYLIFSSTKAFTISAGLSGLTILINEEIFFIAALCSFFIAILALIIGITKVVETHKLEAGKRPPGTRAPIENMASGFLKVDHLNNQIKIKRGSLVLILTDDIKAARDFITSVIHKHTKINSGFLCYFAIDVPVREVLDRHSMIDTKGCKICGLDFMSSCCGKISFVDLFTTYYGLDEIEPFRKEEKEWKKHTYQVNLRDISDIHKSLTTIRRECFCKNEKSMFEKEGYCKNEINNVIYVYDTVSTLFRMLPPQIVLQYINHTGFFQRRLGSIIFCIVQEGAQDEKVQKSLEYIVDAVIMINRNIVVKRGESIFKLQSQ